MRAKLGRARPISETELSFLGTFHLRFRKAAQEAQEESVEATPRRDRPEESAAGQAPEEKIVPPPGPAGKAKPKPKPEPEPTPAAAASARPKRSVQTDVETSATTRAARDRSESRAKAASGAEDDIPTNVLREEADESDQAVAAAPSQAKGPVDEISKAIGPKRLEEALATNDHRTVLRELYREVTAIAEGVWSSEVTPAPMVWEQVTSSDWYERNFSRLGLQPLSVFYEVTAKVDKKVRAGAERKELQEFLKETNFAKTLLSLRDMFQANNI
jgi:outer membrane biosynthesis protein TonB